MLSTGSFWTTGVGSGRFQVVAAMVFKVFSSGFVQSACVAR
jgi:hypothetical protein